MLLNFLDTITHCIYIALSAIWKGWTFTEASRPAPVSMDESKETTAGAGGFYRVGNN